MADTQARPVLVGRSIPGKPDNCRINRCGRPLGVGTHMTLTGYGRASDQTIPVCEEHWQVLRGIFPVEVHRA